MTIEQIIILAIIQGITEFLPVSSSGHLILVAQIFGEDQGIVTDVMVHMGSLMAVIVYFWRDVRDLARGGGDIVRRRLTPHAKMALFIVFATLPAVALGVVLKKTGAMNAIRGAEIVAWNAIIFGILMYLADRFGQSFKKMEAMTLPSALIIGIAQAIAIIPGTSRSGATMTAARALGFTRPEAARFSFLLGIPAITGAGIFVLGDALQSGETVSSGAILAAVLTFFSALGAIHLLMALVKRVSFLPFAIYRVALGVGLLWMINSGMIA